MPALRRALLDVLIPETEPVKTSALAELLGYPTGTTRRALEDLVAHGLVERQAGGEGKADSWALSTWALERYSAANETSPGKSLYAGKGMNKGSKRQGDISGTVREGVE